jgi:hypothetical protein
MGDRHRVVEGPSSSHKRRGGEYAGLVQLANRAIDAKRKAEVIGIDNDAGRHLVQATA